MKKKPIQVFYIQGAQTLKNRKLYLNYLRNRTVYLEPPKRRHGEALSKSLGKGFNVVKTQMPNADNAVYEDWKIHFERLIPLFDKELIIIGNSLGGTFIARYLSENKFPKKLISLYLVAAPYDNAIVKKNWVGTHVQELVGGFKAGKGISKIEKITKHIHLIYSSDDPVVHIAHAEKYKDKLKHASLTIFDTVNGHFKISEFPEIAKMIKQDVKNAGLKSKK